MGVLEAARMYASCISCLTEAVALKWRWTWFSLCVEAGEFLIADMAVLAVLKDILG